MTSFCFKHVFTLYPRLTFDFCLFYLSFLEGDITGNWLKSQRTFLLNPLLCPMCLSSEYLFSSCWYDLESCGTFRSMTQLGEVSQWVQDLEGYNCHTLCFLVYHVVNSLCHIHLPPWIDLPCHAFPFHDTPKP